MASFSFRSRASPDHDTYVKKSAVASKPKLKRTAAGRGRSVQGLLSALHGCG